MEILNSSSEKRTVLIVSDEENDLTELNNILQKHFNTVFISNQNRDYNLIRVNSGALSAAIISAPEAVSHNYALFDWVNSDSMIAAVPMLIYCGGEKDLGYAAECLKRGSVDIIMPPLDENILLNRIYNSIRLKDSATFHEIEKMLQELPSLIYLKDAEGRYVFSTHYWHHLHGADEPGWTIRGKTDPEIRKDKENAEKALQSDLEIIRTGVGTQYVIEINADGKREFLEIIKQPVRNDSGRITGIIGLINNVTEQELIRLSLEEKAMRDELTGTDNRRCFDKYLECLENGSSKCVSIISADCNELKYINDTYGHLVGDEYIRMSSLLFKTVIPENARIFRTGGDEFVMILPGVTEPEAEEYIRRLKTEERSFLLKDRHISISYGAACYDGDADSFHACLDVADKRMYEDKREHKKHAAESGGALPR